DRRHYFARIRTLMANERTLMAYYRAALAMLGISAFVFKFFESLLFNILSATFLLASISLMIYGTSRYLVFKKKILRK
ncbi:DUF202 domain-containing protein, partial [Fulvivirga sp. RKSG066]|uniref:DUF202 domain-containing protein n=1 Tax=Fulvivirga aurantia TaxID=2529383 RepID=UPI0012BCB6BB